MKKNEDRRLDAIIFLFDLFFLSFASSPEENEAFSGRTGHVTAHLRDRLLARPGGFGTLHSLAEKEKRRRVLIVAMNSIVSFIHFLTSTSSSDPPLQRFIRCFSVLQVM